MSPETIYFEKSQKKAGITDFLKRINMYLIAEVQELAFWKLCNFCFFLSKAYMEGLIMKQCMQFMVR